MFPRISCADPSLKTKPSVVAAAHATHSHCALWKPLQTGKNSSLILLPCLVSEWVQEGYRELVTNRPLPFTSLPKRRKVIVKMISFRAHLPCFATCAVVLITAPRLYLAELQGERTSWICPQVCCKFD